MPRNRLPLGSQLKKWRLARNFTLQKVADLLEVTSMTVWRWENQKAQPQERAAYQIERLLGESR